MRCADNALMVHLALDEELDAIGRAEFDRHLQGCRDCAAAFAREKAARATRRTRLQRHRAPPILTQRLYEARTRAGTEPDSSIEQAKEAGPMALPPAMGGGARMALSGFGGAIAAALLAAVLMRASPEENMARAIVESHIGALASGRLFDVAGTDPETIRPWFTGRLDVTPPVKNLASHGFDLVGARLEYVADSRAAALVYRHHEHILTLYIFSTPNAPVASSEPVIELGYAVCRWSRRGITRWVVSDMDPRELEEFEALVSG